MTDILIFVFLSHKKKKRDLKPSLVKIQTTWRYKTILGEGGSKKNIR